MKFKDVDYDLRGTCSYPDYVENSNEYAQFIKALDKKREKERIAREARGSVSIKTKPAKVKASAFVGSTLLGTTPLQVQLQPGNYLLSLKAEGYKEISDSLLVIKDTLVVKDFLLEHTMAYSDSVAASKKMALKKFRLVRRIAFSSLAVASGGIGYYFETQAKKFSDYQGLRLALIKVNSMIVGIPSEQIQNRNIYYALSGVSLGLLPFRFHFNAI